MADQKSIMYEPPLVYSCLCACFHSSFLRLSLGTAAHRCMRKQFPTSGPSVGGLAFSEKLKMVHRLMSPSIPANFW